MCAKTEKVRMAINISVHNHNNIHNNTPRLFERTNCDVNEEKFIQITIIYSKNVYRNTPNVSQYLNTGAYWWNYLNAIMMSISLEETGVAQQKCLLNSQIQQHKNIR